MAYTNIDDPSAHFQIATYTGNLVNGHSITNDGNSDLQPDLTWIKTRSSSTYNHVLVDSSRGNNLVINSNNSNAEANIGVSVVTPSTDGFSLADWSHINYTGVTYVAWQWKANGGTTSSNTSGTITSTVQANTDAGFSIVTYTGNTADGATIGHGLGAVPEIIITKTRDISNNWYVWSSLLSGDTYGLGLNSTAAQAVFTFGNYENVNSSTMGTNNGGSAITNVNGNNNYVAYCFASKQGYSKFGKYTGNGNANGPFVYTGFRPAFIMIKPTNTTGYWVMFDNSRDIDNPATQYLLANTGDAEQIDTGIDFCSNGIKLRSTGGSINGSGNTHIYMAFAENPFVTSTGIPTTAR
jgi:hypothetical protein